MQFEEDDPPPEPLWTAISVLVGTGVTLLLLHFGNPIEEGLLAWLTAAAIALTNHCVKHADPAPIR